MLCPSVGAWLSHEVCERSSECSHEQHLSTFEGSLFYRKPSLLPFFLFYSSTVVQSLLSHPPALWIMKHLGETSLSHEEQPREGLEMHPEAHSQLGLENHAEGLKIMVFSNISSVSWLRPGIPVQGG